MTLGQNDWALWTPVRHGPTEVRGVDGVHALARPSWQHLLGTDDRGRDIVARLVHGARSSALLALGAALGALALALLLALFAVRFGGVIDQGVVFGTGTLSSVPIFVLVVAAQGLLGASGLWVAAFIVALPRGADTARLIRASLLVTEASTYAAASRASGASRWRVLMSHGVRDALGVIVVATALTVSTAVLAEAALGFLGVGVAPPTPSWGELLRQAYENGFPLTMTVPAGLILVAIAAALDRATESAVSARGSSR